MSVFAHIRGYIFFNILLPHIESNNNYIIFNNCNKKENGRGWNIVRKETSGCYFERP